MRLEWWGGYGEKWKDLKYTSEENSSGANLGTEGEGKGSIRSSSLILDSVAV